MTPAITNSQTEIGAGGGKIECRSSVADRCLKITRVKNRVYDGRRIKSHAEYAVTDGEQVFAHLIFNRHAWIVVQRSEPNSFGKAISPMNLTYFADVKKWAIEKWEHR
jgi:hypothetical protein